MGSEAWQWAGGVAEPGLGGELRGNLLGNTKLAAAEAAVCIIVLYSIPSDHFENAAFN